MVINPTAMCVDALTKWFQVQCLKCSFRFHLAPVMGDEQLAFNLVNIRFDAAKTAFERIQERTLMFVVIVGMGPDERFRLSAGAFAYARAACQCQAGYQAIN